MLRALAFVLVGYTAAVFFGVMPMSVFSPYVDFRGAIEFALLVWCLAWLLAWLPLLFATVFIAVLERYERPLARLHALVLGVVSTCILLPISARFHGIPIVSENGGAMANYLFLVVVGAASGFVAWWVVYGRSHRKSYPDKGAKP